MTIQRYFVFALAWLSLAPFAFSQPPGQDARALDAFRKALQRDGFDVNPGLVIPINVVKGWCTGTLPSWFPYPHALYANSQPYVGLRVPKSATEPEPAKFTSIFQLGREEAIVLIGLTPPPERYFGFYPFVKFKMMPDGTKLPLWASLGDTVNNATVKTAGPSPFNSAVALIFTPDQGTDARVRAALQRAGYPAAIINTVVFPASMLTLGHSDTADDLFIAMRNLMWEKKADGDSYMLNPPLHLFRVTPRTATTGNPFPAPRLRVRGTGWTEMDLMNKLSLLRRRIVEDNPLYHATDLVSRPNWYEGYDYIQQGSDPWMDARDAFFLTAGYVPEFGSKDQVTLDDDEFLMVYGVNHVATGKATYHSFNVYSSLDGKVPIGGADDLAFPGSASGYLPDDPDTANRMYALKVSRKCGDGESNCVPLTSEGCPLLTLNKDTVLGVIFRMYLEPATKVGPAMPEILYDRVIKFSPGP